MLGATFSFTFRERMDFDEPHRIDFTHDPAPGVDEKAGVVGWYKLAPRPSGTHLETSMQITVDLPFPGVVRPAVTAAMKGVIALMASGSRTTCSPTSAPTPAEGSTATTPARFRECPRPLI